MVRFEDQISIQFGPETPDWSGWRLGEAYDAIMAEQDGLIPKFIERCLTE